MLFKKTSRFRSQVTIEELKQRLMGQHVKIHNMDFEISERERVLKIIPHAENTENVKSLPITRVEFDGAGTGSTNIKVSSKMRRIDEGGPTLIVMFCLFLAIAAGGMLIAGQPDMHTPSYIMLSIAGIIFLIFWMRMQSGYFDYVRKVHRFVEQASKA